MMEQNVVNPMDFPAFLSTRYNMTLYALVCLFGEKHSVYLYRQQGEHKISVAHLSSRAAVGTDTFQFTWSKLRGHTDKAYV